MTTPDAPPPATRDEGLQEVLDETRHRFVLTFVALCDAMRLLVENAVAGAAEPLTSLAQLAHRLCGLAGTIGFPTISARAFELESLVAEGAASGVFDQARGRQCVDAIESAFAIDLAATARPAAAIGPSTDGATILIVEDDSDQRATMSACLREAGYSPVGAAAGDLVLAAARAEQPALILLDIELPGLDGFAVCRALKADPALAHIPVVFLTGRTSLDDKLAGLTMGADEFLSKPVDFRELVLRIQLLLKRGVAAAAGPVDSAPSPDPAAPAQPAARPAGAMVVIAEDDPDVARIIDAQLRQAGYRTVLATDGERALAAVRANAPDALVLDLMMPRVSGFDVLVQIRKAGGSSPRVMVLSARGREQDVARAFELGADDYMTKPFTPRELMTRLERLLPNRVTAAA